jgi:uncharacterized protein (DUF58 family)
MHLWKNKRLRLSITRLGGQYVLALLLVGAFAVNTGNNLLYLIFSLMLGFFLVSGVVSRRALQGIRPVSLEEGNLFARVRGGLRLRLRDEDPKRWRALELRIELEDGEVEPGFFPGRQGEAEPMTVLHARAGHRGWTRVKSLEIRTCYPFGFLEKAWRFPMEKLVLVLPHPRTASRASVGKDEVQRVTVSRPGESSPEGARPHRPGDPTSRVHWKRTAQRGTPWVRTFETDQPQGLKLSLDLRAFGPGRTFERQLETLSGAVLQARLQKLEVTLEILGGDGRQEYTGYPGCWRALALAQAEGEAGDSLAMGDSGALATTEFIV